jgi:hypothetical protein
MVKYMTYQQLPFEGSGAKANRSGRTDSTIISWLIERHLG